MLWVRELARVGLGFVGSDVDFKKLEHGCRMLHAGSPSLFGLKENHDPTFWLPLLSSAIMNWGTIMF